MNKKLVQEMRSSMVRQCLKAGVEDYPAICKLVKEASGSLRPQQIAGIKARAKHPGSWK